MAFTIKDLKCEVAKLNEKYCKDTKNEFVVSQAYGGCRVELTGKCKKGGGWVEGSLGSGCSSITNGYQSARQTFYDLCVYDSKGGIERAIQFNENKNYSD